MTDPQLKILISIRKEIDGLHDTVKELGGLNRELVSSQEKFRQVRTAAQGMGAMLKTGLGIEIVRRGLDLLTQIPLKIAGAIKAGVDYNANLEQQGAAFETLLGSVEKSEERLRSLVDFAASTPFELPAIVDASKLLQSFSGEALSTGEGLRLVGDAAAAVGQPIGNVSMWFGRLFAALRNGAPMGEAIARLTELGLVSGESRKQLAALEGASLSEAQAMATLRDAFGFTAGAMARQSRTLNGLMSTLRDTLAALGGDLAKPLFASFKSALVEVLQLLGALETESEAAIARVTDQTARLREAARSAAPDQLAAITSDFVEQLSANEQRVRELQTLLSGYLLFDENNDVKERYAGRRSGLEAELAGLAELNRQVRIELGRQGVEAYRGDLDARVERLRSLIAELEQLNTPKETYTFRRSGRKVDWSRDRAKAEASGIANGLERGSPALAQFVDDAIAAMREKMLADNAIVLGVTPGLDAKGQDQLAAARDELADLTANVPQQAGANQAAQERATLLAHHAQLYETATVRAGELTDQVEKLRAAEAQSLATDAQRLDLTNARLAAVDEAADAARAEAGAIEDDAQRAVVLNDIALRLERDKLPVLAQQRELQAKIAATTQQATADGRADAAKGIEARLVSKRSELAAIAYERERAGDDPDLARRRRTEEELIERQRDVLADIVQITREKLALASDPVETARIEAQVAATERERDHVGTGTQGTAALGVGESFGVGVMDWVTSLGSQGEQIAALLQGTIGTAAQGISDTIYGWTTGAGDFGDVLLGIGDTALRQLIDMVVNMGLQWIISGSVAKATMTGISALGSLLRKKEASETIAAESAKAPALQKNALTANAGSFGLSAVIGLALLAALLAAFTFRERGGDMQAGHPYIVGERRAEVFVPDQPGTMHPSVDDYVNRYGSGQNLAATMDVPGLPASSPMGAGAAGAATALAAGMAAAGVGGRQGNRPMNVAFFGDNMRAAKDWAESQEGDTWFYDTMRKKMSQFVPL